MSSSSWGLTEVGGAIACVEAEEPLEALEVWQAGNTIEPALANNQPLRVLVVDDYRDAADSLAMLVKFWGHEVRVAYDGAAGLAMASAYRPDVLLLDIVMSTMSGFRLAQLLRRQPRFQDTLLVAITGYGDLAHRLLWEKTFDRYFVKPVEPSSLEILLTFEQSRRVTSAVASRSILRKRQGI